MKARLRSFCIVSLILILSGGAFGEAIMIPQTPGYPSDLIPLRRIHADITIQDQVVLTTVDQKFDAWWNGGDIDVFYAYPVPEQASVTGFGRWIDGSVYYYPLVPEEQQQPGDNGGDNFPDIMEYLQPNPFFAPLQDLPNTFLDMRLEYAQLMAYDFGEYVFTYPLNSPFLAGSIDSIIVDISITSQRTISGIIVENYDMEILNQDDNSASLLFTDVTTIPDEDMVIRVMVDPGDTGMWVMPHCEDPDSNGHFLAVLEPGVVEPDHVFQKYFTFVLDVSGSMVGNKLEEAKEAAEYCVSHLDEDDYLNIITFAYSVSSWQPDPVPATASNINQAISYINSRTAGGGTNLNAGMMEALAQATDTTAANQILLLSDGQPTAGVTSLPQILDNIEEANESDASIFTIGVGLSNGQYASNLDFLRMIGYENHGLSLFIDENDPNISEQIEVFFTRFSQPAMIDIHVSYGEIGVYDYYPPEPYTIFVGAQTLVAGRYEPGGEAYCTLTGQVVGEQVELTYGPFDFSENANDYLFVPRMWAKAKIDYWLAWMAVNGEDQEIIDMIIELSLRYGILTPYTSYDTPVEEGRIPVQAVLERGAVKLSWRVPVVPDDAVFVVYRSDNGGRTFLRLTDRPITVQTYTDRQAVAGETYVYRIEMISEETGVVAGDVRITVPLRGRDDTRFSLYPNPFNAEARVSFMLDAPADVRVELYNVLGRKVATLMQGHAQVGAHLLRIDGNDFASGTYFMHLNVQPHDGQPMTRIERLVITK